MSPEKPDLILYADPRIEVRRLEANDPVTGVPLAVVEMRLSWPNADPPLPDVVIPLTADDARQVGQALVEKSLGLGERN